MTASAGIRGAGVIQRYADYLPLTDRTPRITLGEGGTPLIESRHIASELGLGSLHFKFEGLNPTGSFKDRGMVFAVARALEVGSRAIICASTGNTSASAAAYGARFGLRTVVVVPAGKIALGKLVQAQVFGATVLIIEGNFDEALRSVRQLAETHPVTLVNSVNPNRIEGQKTAAFEVVDELGDAPDVLAIPVGNAGNITATGGASGSTGRRAGRPSSPGWSAVRRREPPPWCSAGRSPTRRPSPPPSGSATRHPGPARSPPGTSRRG